MLNTYLKVLSVNKWIVVVLVFAVLAGGLYWQTESKGKLKAQNDQLVMSVEELVKAAAEDKARAEKHNKRRAETAEYNQELEKETNELRRKLKALSDCDSNPFSNEFINWVREYRSQN